MNESLSGKENNEPATQPKLFGLPRPLAGALIGLLSFIVVFALSESLIPFVGWILLTPYEVLSLILFFGEFSNGTFLASVLDNSFWILVFISSLPYAMLGALMFSKKSTAIKITTVSVFILYLMCSCVITILFFFVAGLASF